MGRKHRMNMGTVYSHTRISKITHQILEKKKKIIFTHVECDSDDVEAHSGVCDTAEGWRLERQEDDTMSETFEIVKVAYRSISISPLICFSHSLSISISAGEVKCLRGAHPVYFSHFVPPSAALVSAHQLWRRTLFCGTTEPETQRQRGIITTWKGRERRQKIWLE